MIRSAPTPENKPRTLRVCIMPDGRFVDAVYADVESTNLAADTDELALALAQFLANKYNVQVSFGKKQPGKRQRTDWKVKP